MNLHFDHQAPTSDLDLFDCRVEPPPATHAARPIDREPSDLEWRAFAEWRPPCFGRLALEYVMRFGLSVLPLLVDESAPVSLFVPRKAADASRDPFTIHAWWTQAPRANVGIACELSGLIVVEVDPGGGGPETLAMHARRLGPLPATWTARTPSGWTQYFFAHADAEAAALARLRDLGPGVRVTHRGHVVAPPSVVEGQRAAWHLDARPGRAPLAAMPVAWMDRLTGRTLPPNGLSGLDARHSILGWAFEALGWLGRMLDDGRRIALCPWADEHAWPGGAGGDCATVLYSPEYEPWFGCVACSHPECANRGPRDVLDLLPQEVLSKAHAAFPGSERRDMRPVDRDLFVAGDRLRDAQRLLATFDLADAAPAEVA